MPLLVHFVSLRVIHLEGDLNLPLPILHLVHLLHRAAIPPSVMIFAIDQISRFQSETPLERSRPGFKGCDHIATPVQVDRLIVAIVEIFNLDFVWFEGSHPSPRPGSLAGQMGLLEDINEIALFELIDPRSICLPDVSMRETLSQPLSTR